MKKGKEIYVLDTSALFAYIEDEDGAEDVENLLIKAENGEINALVVFISIVEIMYITIREKGEEEALRRFHLTQSLAVRIIESNEDFTLQAGRLKAFNKISFADAYIAAVCLKIEGTLVHKDPEFEKVQPPIKEYRLPFKTES